MDRYTKAILTVIAIALSIEVIQRTTTPAQAAGGLTRVAICDPAQPSVCANIFKTMNPMNPRAGLGVFVQSNF